MILTTMNLMRHIRVIHIMRQNIHNNVQYEISKENTHDVQSFNGGGDIRLIMILKQI